MPTKSVSEEELEAQWTGTSSVDCLCVTERKERKREKASGTFAVDLVSWRGREAVTRKRRETELRVCEEKVVVGGGGAGAKQRPSSGVQGSLHQRDRRHVLLRLSRSVL